MPPFDRATDAHKAIIGQLLGTDAELQGIAREFVKLGMVELINQLKRGDPATRAAIARSLANVVTKAITEAAEGEGDDTLRAEMHQMMEEMRGDIMGEEKESPAVVPKRVLVPKK